MKLLFFISLYLFGVALNAQDTVRFVIRSPQKPKDSARIYTITEVSSMPEFVGGYQALLKYINKNLNFPVSALSGPGIGYYAFIVEADGKVSQVRIQKGVPDCKECDDEAVRVLKSLPAFIPGTIKNAPVPMLYQLPIRFTL